MLNKQQELLKEEFEILKKYEKEFTTITLFSYKTGNTKKECEEVFNILDKYTIKYTRNSSCANCQYNAFKQAAKLYYEYLDTQKNINTEENNGQTEQLSGNNGQSAKRGRKNKQVKIDANNKYKQVNKHKKVNNHNKQNICK